ncbi:MAG TPA: ABC transporter permease [Candidatus Obscuribacterales bacterium]
MTGLILRRCISAVPLIFLVSVFAFALIRLVPGDPVDVLLGASEKDLSPEQVAALRHEMGLDQPPVKQYLAWLAGFWGEGELGRSYRDGRPVLAVIGERLPATVALVGTSLVLAGTLGIAFGLAMAWAATGRTVSYWSPILRMAALFLYSAPGFWLASIAIFCVGRWLPWLPISGLNDPGQAPTLASVAQHVLLPASILSLRRAAKLALFIRAMVLEEMSRDYVLIALAKGLSWSAVLARHILRNSLLPVVALLGLSLPALLGGSVLIETVFAWPGMGRLAVEAAFGRNYPLLLTLVVVYGAMVVVSTLIADLLYSLVDPRLRETQAISGLSGSPAASGMAS